ncbi:MAG: zinc ribbon domain-containing protein [Lachnospiraceae bacterium]|nr:zinc ribbon domain-containing protein [Lachnospiraceae bacterium]
MNCQKCGAQLEEGAKFCEMCGTPAPAAVPVNMEIGSVHKTYSQNSFHDDNGDYDVSQGFNTKKIRKWFEGASYGKWILLIIIGAVLVTVIIGIPILIIGIVGLVRSFTAGVNEVDMAWNAYADVLSKRGIQKLNVIEEQVNLIDPVVLVGFGASPDSSFEAAKELGGSRSALGRLFSFSYWLSLLARLWPFGKKTKGTELDPYEASRIGKDDILRSMLMSVSVYRFSEEQVLIYTGNLDISTGLIYNERTEEVFYQDIEGIRFSQSVFKVYSTNKKRFVNKARESLELYLSGCTLHASFRTDMNTSVIQNQFSAMRSLIRDKKNS